MGTNVTAAPPIRSLAWRAAARRTPTKITAVISAIHSPRLIETMIGIAAIPKRISIPLRTIGERARSVVITANGVSTPTVAAHWLVYAKSVIGLPIGWPSTLNWICARAGWT